MYREDRDASTSSRSCRFCCESVALDTEMMQADGLHPNARAQPALLDTVWPQLQPLLRRNAEGGLAR